MRNIGFCKPRSVREVGVAETWLAVAPTSIGLYAGDRFVGLAIHHAFQLNVSVVRRDASPEYDFSARTSCTSESRAFSAPPADFELGKRRFCFT